GEGDHRLPDRLVVREAGNDRGEDPDHDRQADHGAGAAAGERLPVAAHSRAGVAAASSATTAASVSFSFSLRLRWMSLRVSAQPIWWARAPSPKATFQAVVMSACPTV